MKFRSLLLFAVLVTLLWLDAPVVWALVAPQHELAGKVFLALNWNSLWSRVTDPVFWVELYVHFLAVCSGLYRFVLVPLEEWAHDPDNCSPAVFKRIHSFSSLVGSYGALNKRANLGDFAIKELRQTQDADTAEKKANSKGAGQ